jgi:hypothetical protein
MKNLSFKLNLATWIAAMILLLIPQLIGTNIEVFAGHIIATLFWMAVYYLFFLYLTPEFLMKKKLVLFFALSAGAIFILPFFGYTLLFLSRALITGEFSEFYGGYSFVMHMSGLKAVLLAGLFGSLFRMICEQYSID